MNKRQKFKFKLRIEYNNELIVNFNKLNILKCQQLKTSIISKCKLVKQFRALQFDKAFKIDKMNNLFDPLSLNQQNLVMIKKHHRRLVDKAYKKSQANTNYTFPINPNKLQDNYSDTISLQSRCTEVYDLHEQNNRINTQFSSDTRQIISIGQLLKRKTQNRNCFQTHQKKKIKQTLVLREANKIKEEDITFCNLNGKCRKRYLSLTPKKIQTGIQQQQNTHKIITKSLSKSSGITLTKNQSQKTILKPSFHKGMIKNYSKTLIKQQKQSQNFPQQIIESIKRMTSKCFNLDPQLKQSDNIKTQIIFFDSQQQNPKQQFLNDKTKYFSSKTLKQEQLTLDSTPNLSKNQVPSIQLKKDGQIFRAQQKRQNIHINSFNYGHNPYS